MVTLMDPSTNETLTVHSDDDDGCMSSRSSDYSNSTDLMTAAMGDDVTAQLAAAGWPKQHFLGDCWLLFLIIKFFFYYNFIDALTW